MKHREAHDGREPVSGEASVGGVTVDHFNVRFGYASAKWLRQTAINLGCSEPGDPLANHVRRDAGSGPDLQDIVTKFTGCLDPRQEVSIEYLCPFKAGEEMEMEMEMEMGLVHGGILHPPIGRVDPREAPYRRDSCLLRGIPGGSDFLCRGGRILNFLHPSPFGFGASARPG